MRLSRLAALCGIAGPVLFTAGWVISSARQAGHGLAEVQLSGLAADEARDPQIMAAAFVLLGACQLPLGTELVRVTAPRAAGGWLVVLAGACTAAAGLFRRDHMLLTGPGFAAESWHNQVHDAASAAAYAAMLAAPVVLGLRLRDDPDWAGVARPVLVLALASGGALAVFASRVIEPWNGTLQRAAVSCALAAEVLIAARLLTRPPRPGPPGTGQRPPGRSRLGLRP